MAAMDVQKLQAVMGKAAQQYERWQSQEVGTLACNAARSASRPHATLADNFPQLQPAVQAIICRLLANAGNIIDRLPVGTPSSPKITENI